MDSLQSFDPNTYDDPGEEPSSFLINGQPVMNDYYSSTVRFPDEDTRLAYDNEEDVDDNGDHPEHNDNIPVASVMPDEYYQSIDSFLNMPPPKALLIPNGRNNSKKSKDTSTAVSTSAAKNPYSSIKSKINTKSQSNKSRINEDLLREAFAYSNKLAADDEYELQQQQLQQQQLQQQQLQQQQEEVLMANQRYIGQVNSRKGSSSNSNTVNSNVGMYHSDSSSSKPSSAGSSKSKSIRLNSSNSNPYSSGGTSKKSSNSAVSMVKKLRSQAKSSSTNLLAANVFDLSSEPEKETQRNAIDYDGLVANFQQSLTLNKLKAELQQSQQSMIDSKAMMEKIAMEFKIGKKKY